MRKFKFSHHLMILHKTNDNFGANTSDLIVFCIFMYTSLYYISDLHRNNSASLSCKYRLSYHTYTVFIKKYFYQIYAFLLLFVPNISVPCSAPLLVFLSAFLEWKFVLVFLVFSVFA